jgi:hypothetical protein
MNEPLEIVDDYINSHGIHKIQSYSLEKVGSEQREAIRSLTESLGPALHINSITINFSKPITQEILDAKLIEMAKKDGVDALLSIEGVVERVREYYNKDVLQALVNEDYHAGD